MNRALQISEIVRTIFNTMEKRNGSLDRKAALSMTLACRDFLDPGLDTIWRELDRFDAIVSCTPEDLWEREELVIPDGEGTEWDGVDVTVMHLRRALTLKDLSRYLERYAHRVRVVRIAPFQPLTMFSNEAFHAIQLATKYQSGVMSPHLRSLDGWFPRGLEDNAHYPFMSLFLGKQVTHLNFEVLSDLPVQDSSIRYALEGAPRLTSPTITHGFDEDIAYTPISLTNFAPGITWDDLETVKLDHASASTVAYLGTLPRLEALHFSDPEAIPLLNPSVQQQAAQAPFFPALRWLVLSVSNLSQAMGVITYLSPSTTVLKSLYMHCYPNAPSQQEDEGACVYSRST